MFESSSHTRTGPLEVDEAERQAELELQNALERARRLKSSAMETENTTKKERLASMRVAALLTDDEKPAGWLCARFRLFLSFIFLFPVYYLFLYMFFSFLSFHAFHSFPFLSFLFISIYFLSYFFLLLFPHQ